MCNTIHAYSSSFSLGHPFVSHPSVLVICWLPDCTGDLHGCEVSQESDGEDRDEGNGHEHGTVDQR